MPKVAILAAMKEEIEAFYSAHKLVLSCDSEPFTEFRFRAGSVDVVLVRSGVGKVMAAMVAQRVIDRVKPDYLIVTGIAGSVCNGLELGDVVVSRDCIQHDLDARALGFKLGQVPYSDYRILLANERLVKLALATPVRGQRVLSGRILTGDQFVSAPDKELRKRLEGFEGSVVEMEGASIALVATVNRVPFVIIRSVSDKTNAKAPADFGAYLRRAATNSYTVCAGILSALT